MGKKLCTAVLGIGALSVCSAGIAQMDVEADPVHHKSEFENKCVRVVRAVFGPHEKSAGFFDAKDVVIVSLTGGPGLKLHFPDGNSVDTPPSKPGQVGWAPAGRIQPENASDTRIEFIVIEPKGCN
ncbi:MAG TPA: hypothetical protein VMH32_22540 [Burkholderiales bacterium]|nr:hypothetical protein [Burkholderiales bacterium]